MVIIILNPSNMSYKYSYNLHPNFANMKIYKSHLKVS